MWILAIIFVLIILACMSSDSSRKKRNREFVNEVNRKNAAKSADETEEAPRLVLHSEEDEIARLKEQAKEVARRTGATITGWGDVKTDENGQRYIECHMHTDDEKVPELMLEQGKVFGDKIISSTYTLDKDKKDEQPTTTSNADEIAKWFNLKEKGAITEEEYRKQIEKLL